LRNSASAIPRINEIAWAGGEKPLADQLAANHEGEQQADISDL
jgi:hypothetical protein